MKAVVVEIKNGYAALLQADGSVVKLRNRSFTIGDVVNMKEKAMVRKGRFSAIVAVAAMFVILMGAGVWAYATPVYYVSLDVNPSVLMEVNLFERVIGMEATNDDAASVLAGFDWKNKHIEHAISEAVERIAKAGYFGKDGGNVLITSTAKNNKKAERLAGKLRGVVEEEILENGVIADVEAGAMGYDMVQDAKELGITAGKLNVITNLLGEELGDNVNESIKDLMIRYTVTKGAEGRERAEEAATGEENGEPAENADLKEENVPVETEQGVDLDNKPETPKEPEIPTGGRP